MKYFFTIMVNVLPNKQHKSPDQFLLKLGGLVTSCLSGGITVFTEFLGMGVSLDGGGLLFFGLVVLLSNDSINSFIVRFHWVSKFRVEGSHAFWLFGLSNLFVNCKESTHIFLELSFLSIGNFKVRLSFCLCWEPSTMLIGVGQSDSSVSSQACLCVILHCFDFSNSGSINWFGGSCNKLWVNRVAFLELTVLYGWFNWFWLFLGLKTSDGCKDSIVLIFEATLDIVSKCWQHDFGEIFECSYKSLEVTFNDFSIFVTGFDSLDSVLMFVIPVLFLTNVSVDLLGIVSNSVLSRWDMKLDILGGIKNLEEWDLQVAVSVLVAEEESVLGRLDKFNDGGDVSLFSCLNVCWDIFEVGGASVTDIVVLFSKSIVVGSSIIELNKLWAIKLSIIPDKSVV